MTEEFHRQLLPALPHLQRFCRYLTANRDEAEELFQLAVERALSRQDQWQESRGMKGWLLRIAYTQFINERKSRAGRSGFEPDKTPGSQKTDPDLFEPSHDDNPERCLAAKQVGQAIMLLPEGQRSLLILVCLEGFSYREAAELLELPIGTVMSRLARARQAMRLWYDAQESRGPKEVRNHGQ